MFSNRLVSTILATLLILTSLAACAPVPPATQPLAGTAAVSGQQAVPAAASTPVPTPTLAPSPTPAVPDPKADPLAALLYASGGELFKTAEFTYTMTMNMAPADDASAKALGIQADQLKNLTMEATGSGAMEVTDPANLKSRMRMDMDIDAYGQQMQMQFVVIDQTAWVKVTGQDAWQKVEGEQAKSLAPGMDPEKMLRDLEAAVDVQWIEDVSVNGEELSHLRFSLDPSKVDFSSLVAGSLSSLGLTPEEAEAMYQDMFGDTKPAVDVWLAKSNLELRGEKMRLTWVMPLPDEGDMAGAKILVDVTMDTQFSNVNEPLTIEPPAE